MIRDRQKCTFSLALVVFIAIGLSGCAHYSSTPALRDELLGCLEIFNANDQLIRKMERVDAQYARVSEFPYLRINRLLASLKNSLDDAAKRALWLVKLGELDKEARLIENSNLLHASGYDESTFNQCRAKLIEDVANNQATFEQLLARAYVPDSYSQTSRIAGFYYLTRWPVFRGALALQARETPSELGISSHASPLKTYGPEGNLTALIAPTEPDLDQLGFPQLSERELANLLTRYAPQWRIETVTNDDIPGRLVWSENAVSVDTQAPTTYQNIAFTLFEEQLLLQLSYTIWFSGVPAKRPFDLYAGELDGVTFRLTLDQDFKPLIADIMHNCGCYYMAFPSQRLRRRANNDEFEEPLWVPHKLPILADDQRFNIRLRAGDHFVQALDAGLATTPDHKLTMASYDQLRRLRFNQMSTRSAFSARGLIENSHRYERFILWPMGVLSAGAMRQTGHHAIAFIGRRHFDDANLIARYFVRP